MAFLQIISIACITLFFLLGGFLISRQPLRQNKHKLLGVFLLLLGFNFLDGQLLLTGVYLEYPQAAMWEDPFALLYGPVIYLYCRQLTGRRTGGLTLSIHVLPFILLQLMLGFYYHLGTAELRLTVLKTAMARQQPVYVFVTILAVLTLFFIYLFFANRILKRHRNSLEQHYSTLDIAWIHQLLVSLLVVFMLSLMASVLQFTGLKLASEVSLILVLLAMLVFMTRFLFHALKQPLLQEKVSGPGYVQAMDKKEMEAVKTQLIDAVEQSKLFLNPELTIEDLASQLNIPTRQLSQVINATYDQNFYEFVNTYRIGHARKILEENKEAKLTVLEVMYASGFNSKSSFNTQFKRQVGMTPTEYRKSLN